MPRRCLLLAGLTLALAVPAASAAPSSYVIQGDYRIDGYAVKANGKLAGAVAAFGQPGSLRRGPRENCAARWPSLGLRIGFYNLGGANPCRPETGFFGSALVTGRRWRTANGLRIGDRAITILIRHPKARPSPQERNWWWLVPRFTQATGGYGGLEAKVVKGRVAAFRVNYQAGGE